MNSTNADSLSAPRAGTRAQGSSRFHFFRQPRLRRHWPRFVLAAIASLIGASSIASAGPLELGSPPAPLGPTAVALSGTAAPAGGSYSSFGNFVLNGSGQVAFQANLTGGSSTGGIFAGTPGSVQSAALQGTAAPAGGNYNVFGNTLALNSSGQVAFNASLTGGASSNGMFVGAPGSMQAFALVGTTSPAGGTYSSFGTFALNGTGKLALDASMSGGSSSRWIFVGTPGSVQAAALVGSAAPAGGNYSAFFGTPVLNASGQMAIVADLTGGSSTRGLFVGAPGSVQAAALQGSAAPTGGNYSTISAGPGFNDAGQLAFTSTLTGGSSGSGLFVGAPGSLQTAALAGSAAPAGGNYNVFNSPLLNGSGQLVVLAPLTGGSSSVGIFAGSVGALQTIARSGIATPDGVGNFSSFTLLSLGLNTSGQVAFISTLSGSGVTTANDTGLYAGSAGNLVKLVREGDNIDVDPSAGVDLRTVSAIGNIAFSNGSGGQDGKPMSLNDDGLLVYKLSFTDGSTGIFTSQVNAVPEPGTVGLLAAGSIVVLWKLRRRQR